MYEGKNPTAMQSQQWITAALLEMMRQMPYASISVRDLCRKADLSRQTFYNLYGSKEEVLHVYLRAEVKKVHEALVVGGSPRKPGIRDMVEAFTTVLLDNRENLRLMIDQGLRGVVADEIANAVSLFADSFADRRKQDEQELRYAAAFLSGGLAFTLLQWLREDTPPDGERLAQILETVLRGEMYNL